ncbi:MAG TPA: CbiX/SirB N-terminal domain-containing protein, partial [Pseudonocardiaceae bacterium]|nr:CbiX/SirB N-terminal domain-containing protein [Pseudonocardiaceae bacterium]
MPDPTTPLLIIGHGTADQHGVDEFLAFITRMRHRMAPAGIPVAGGFIELSAPAVTEAWLEVTHSHRQLAAVPLVL